MELLVPVPETAAAALTMAPRLRDLAGKRVGFIDNGWWCSGIVFDVLEVELKERYGVAQVIRQAKGKSSPVPRQDIERLAKEVDAVVTALGN